ncbi:5886_t:CDS:2 [Gigaspora rosea]|nr:5886_t:CDS:2 [Gigaspora rosea]
MIQKNYGIRAIAFWEGGLLKFFSLEVSVLAWVKSFGDKYTQ